MSGIHKIELHDKLGDITEHWSPHTIASLNGQHVRLAKFKGDFIWHHHEQEDEMFLVLSGRFRMDLRDARIWIEEGEAIVIPRGVEHKPYAEEEVSVLLFEPASTVNTGNRDHPLTRRQVPGL